MISKIKTPDDILTDSPVCFFQIISNFDFFFQKKRLTVLFDETTSQKGSFLGKEDSKKSEQEKRRLSRTGFHIYRTESCSNSL